MILSQNYTSNITGPYYCKGPGKRKKKKTKMKCNLSSALSAQGENYITTERQEAMFMERAEWGSFCRCLRCSPSACTWSQHLPAPALSSPLFSYVHICVLKRVWCMSGPSLSEQTVFVCVLVFSDVVIMFQ